MDQRISIDPQNHRLEGIFHPGHNGTAAIVTHPHPLYGGNMDNAVVITLVKAYQREGWATLRFNFRSVNRPQDHLENGSGEQSDLQTAITHLQDLGFENIHLTGYSFGAWVLAGWAMNHPHRVPHPIHMIAPPVALIPFPEGRLPTLRTVITGRLDDLAPPGQIESYLPHWHSGIALKVIEDADHFFWNHMDVLERVFSQSIHG